MLRAVLLFAALAVSNPATGAQVAPVCDPEAEAVRQVRAVALGIIEADNARDIERVLRYYSAHAVLMPPGERVLVGRDAIRPRYEELFSRFNPQIETRIDEACAGGDLAFVRGHNGGRLAARQNGEARELDDAYLMVLQRDGKGDWQISHLMWHRASASGTTASE